MQVIDKTETERIQIELKSYKGKEYMDIRIFFKNDEGEWLPTKKGVTVSVHNRTISEAFRKNNLPRLRRKRLSKSAARFTQLVNFYRNSAHTELKFCVPSRVSWAAWVQIFVFSPCSLCVLSVFSVASVRNLFYFYIPCRTKPLWRFRRSESSIARKRSFFSRRRDTLLFRGGLLDFVSFARLRGLPKSARWLRPAR